MNKDSGEDVDRLATTIVISAESIRTIDRLLCRSAGTVVRCHVRKGQFARSVSPWDPVLDFHPPHPLTSAQCVDALQRLQCAVSRLDISGVERRGMKELTDVDKKRTIQNAIENGLKGNARADIRAAVSALDSSEFGVLNPFTCSQVFKVLTPSGHGYGASWWASLFGMFWSLNRKFPAVDVSPGASISDVEPTAFVTGKCLDAIAGFLQLFRRRYDRFEEFVGLLKDVTELEKKARKSIGPGWEQDPECTHQRLMLQNRLRVCVDSIMRDVALEKLFTELRAALDEGGRDKVKTGAELEDRIRGVLRNPIVKNELRRAQKGFEDVVRAISDAIVEPIITLADRIEGLTRGGRRKALGRGEMARIRRCVKMLWPSRNEFARAALKMIASQSRASRLEEEDPWSVPSIVREYWQDQANAAKEALDACSELSRFLVSISKQYTRLPHKKPGAEFIEGMHAILGDLGGAETKLRKRVDGSVKWAKYTAIQQLSLAQSGVSGLVDPGELIHGAWTAVLLGELKDTGEVLSALEATVREQRRDGTWQATRPFFSRKGGPVSYANSMDIARAVVGTMNAAGDQLGLLRGDRHEVVRRLVPVWKALEEVVEWLKRTGQLIVWSEAAVAGLRLTESERQESAFGWCSDRAMERDRIHIATTANAVGFLVEYRELIQRRINETVRVGFVTYDPATLPRLEDVSPTDLGAIDGKTESKGLHGEISELIAQYRIREMQDTRWLARRGKLEDPQIAAMLLYGPPGSSKTFLAKAIARELGWPLVVVTPSDFLTSGEGGVEARAREVFQILTTGSRLVLFFDEVDELFLGRDLQRDGQERSIFTFLTPSFLTKLQDLHDACKKRLSLAIIGTNYVDRMDAAVRRRGRVDREFAVLYPDELSREAIVRRETEKGLGKLSRSKRRSLVQSVAKATPLFSYSMLDQLCRWISARAGDWGTVEEKLKVVKAGRDLEFRPEISLSIYRGRPGAYGELASLLGIAGASVDRKEEVQRYLASLPAERRDDIRGRLEAALKEGGAGKAGA